MPVFYLASYTYGLKRRHIDKHWQHDHKRLRLEHAPWFFNLLEPQTAHNIEETHQLFSQRRVAQNARAHGLIRSLTLMLHNAHLVLTIAIPLKKDRAEAHLGICAEPKGQG